MKKIFLYMSGLLMLAACDKVTNPIVKSTTVVGSKFVVKSNSAVSNSKKTLLEDFTGQRCLNCPTASRIVKNDLLPVYNDNLIVVAIHQGQLAAPYGQEFPFDFRTTAGETWGGSGGFGPITIWPTGLINRKNYNANGLTLSSSKWTSVVPLANADPFIVKLDVVTEYDTTLRALNVNVKGTFKMSYTNPIKVVALFLEDGLEGVQIDGGNHIEDYEHEHMLRGDINSTWGSDFTTAAIQANDSAKWSISGFPLPEYTVKAEKGQAINDKKVTVVVYVYDVTTREVLQAEKVKIR
jgi:hypothetical protein